ncbi:hypothetical protein BD309DRAFT_519344 [Dichomitus squalens]|uniref:Uncharacterized protein n=2 Tax=Dichomitus squalens TaxID=114155 RepID=A0A4Q9N2V9_9APHY|nr:uncharacterized protein DICSQDRAFT_104800 [Dichomitus squalens LYAD-421 SS1]EJF62346.1 hypothetical protein DICSQDRAFT_104800 [Dichomitus squalens LYAD-421 SS1]TBU33076.1 hypothetical protein BD311DRAFT_475425 [Dichomitus squalens]TBU47259.1 hypothetical protein BD309DRAFT_519344 [Dichomitus squalens]TBU63191.1 hypothetical protein BD310DRAFT_621283 [Dichomitus squalens]
MVLNALVNKPNRVVEKQKLVQSSHEPIYYRLPRSKLYVNAYFALFTVGMLSSTYGIYRLIRGKPAGE